MKFKGHIKTPNSLLKYLVKLKFALPKALPKPKPRACLMRSSIVQTNILLPILNYRTCTPLKKF